MDTFPPHISKIKAIVSDVDGTLIEQGSMGNISAHLNKLASDLVHAKIPLCFATGFP